MKRALKLLLRANIAPSKLPFAISAVAHASASAQVRATTVTEAGDAISGAPRTGSMVCDRRPALHLDPVPVVPRGRHGSVLKRENGMGRAAGGVRRVDFC